MNAREEVDSLYVTIDNATERLSEIREKCTHPEMTIGYFQWAPGHIQVKMLCDICDQPVRDPTDLERSEFDDVLNPHADLGIQKVEFVDEQGNPSEIQST